MFNSKTKVTMGTIELYFGACRFCLSGGHHKDLVKEYNTNGEREVYADMLLECFNIFIATDAECRSLICAHCVSRVRAARQFRDLVLHAEHSMRALRYSQILQEPASIETRVKTEPAELEDAEIKTEPCDELDITEHELTRPGDGEKSGVKEDVVTKIEKETQTDDYIETYVNKKEKRLDRLSSCKSRVTAKERRELARASVITRSQSNAAHQLVNKFKCFYCNLIFTDTMKLKAHQDTKHMPLPEDLNLVVKIKQKPD